MPEPLPASGFNTGILQSFQNDPFTGRAGLSIPVVSPPGRRGIQQNLALTYSSQRANGLCGVGWDIESAHIQRSTKRGIPKYIDSQDTFVFSFSGSTQELVNISAGEYRAKTEGAFLKFIYDGVYWQIIDKQGTKYYFGTTADSKQVNPRGTFAWYLAKVIDVHGNYLLLDYIQNEGQIYLANLKYTGNELQGELPTYTAELTYETRPDIFTNSHSGSLIKTAKRLKEIAVKFNQDLTRKIVLTYKTSSPTSRSLLTSVTQYGSDGITSLPPVNFTYIEENLSFDSVANWNGVVGDGAYWSGIRAGWAGATNVDIIDINGDGLPDRVMRASTAPYTHWDVQLNNGTGFDPVIQWTGVEGAGHSHQNWFAPHASENYQQSGVVYQSIYVDLFDINGDGLPDRVIRADSPYNHFKVQLNNGTGFNSVIQWNGVVSDGLYYGSVRAGWAGATNVDIMDINGDGLPDRVMRPAQAPYTHWDVQLNNGTGFDPVIQWTGVNGAGYSHQNWFAPRAVEDMQQGGAIYQYTYVDLFDINGDGLPDRVIRTDSSYDHFKVQLNNGTGFDAIIQWNGVVGDGAYWSGIRAGWAGATNVDIMDINGDGLPDRVMRANTAPYGHWDIQLNNGTGFNPVIQWAGVNGAGYSHPNWSSVRAVEDMQQGGTIFQYTYVDLFDMNGDGLPDRVIRTDSSYDHFKVQESSIFYPDLLISINNGVGGTTNIAYKPSTQFENNGSDSLPDLPFPVLVVSSTRIADGLGNSYTTTYEYKDGLYDWQEREFSGFGYIKTTDPEGNYTETYFKQDNIFKGRPYLVLTKNSSGTLYNKSENTYSSSQVYPGSHFAYLIQTDTYLYDGLTTFKQTRAKFEYDDYGNSTKTISEGDATQSGDEKTVLTEYNYNTADWIISLPKRTYALDLSGNKISEKFFYYDNSSDINTAPLKGLLTKDEVWCYNPLTSSAQLIATKYNYDAYANLTTTTDHLQRTVTATYETDLHIYPKQVVNSLNHTIKSTYDYKTGQTLTSTDPNNKTTTSVYDALGRVFKVIDPLDTEDYPGVIYEYDLSALPTKVTKKVKSSDAPVTYLTTYQFYDGLGRAIQTKTPAEPDPTTGQARQIISDIAKFDSRGQVKEKYLPYFVNETADYITPSYTTPHATFIYDALGRLIQTNNPDGTSSSVAYSQWKTSSTDENGHIKIQYVDAYGKIIKIEEHNGDEVYATNYEYDALGNLTKTIDNQGNIAQIWYDTLGRKIKMDDPDMGIWLYEYDAVGNLIKQTDAKGQILIFSYDSLNRLIKKQGLSPYSKVASTTLATYYYDDPLKQNCVGRLSKITDLSGSTSFYYDVLGREIKSTKTVDGKAYAVSRQYDVLNRLTSLTYPDRTVVQYEYNPQGIESIKELFPTGTVPYVSNIDYTPTGQIIKIQYGNNTETNYTYDPDNLRLIHVNTLSPYGTIQNLAYQFDNIGNITQINDTINTATQSFSYDSLNRLIQAQGSYGSFNYAYDSIGNMIQKEGVTLSYGTSGRLPHAVRQYGNTAISYDANGNMISKGLSPAGGLSLTYDIENRLIKVTQTMSPTEAVPRSTINYPAIFSFTYDGDGGRVKKTIKVKGLSPQRTASEQNTIYIGSLFEKDSSGKTTRYIFSGSNRICAISQGLSPQGTIPRINYYHSDHLGSSNVITDNQGQQVGFTEFTPYGSTYKQTGSYDPKFKFTGKELDNTGLYFYGARYYDPQLGRFTSADTIVQAPYDPQSLNRYAYCRNNPINLVDPSGHSWWSKFWKGVGEFFENIFKNPIPFIASLFAAVVTSWAIAPMIKGLSGAMAVSGKGVTFWEGFILGGVEVGSPAFTGTLAASLAGGDKFSTAIKNAFIGGGITFVTAGLIEGAYAEGWQKVVHFQDVREDSVKAQIEKYNILENQGRFQEAMDVKTSLMKNYDFYADAKSNIIGRGIQHIDKVASKTTGEFAGIKFDWVGKESKLNWVRVLASDTINGKFSAIDRTTFISTNYRSLIFQSASPQVVDRAISIMPTLYGKEGNYILYGVGTFNCYNGAAEVDRRIRN